MTGAPRNLLLVNMLYSFIAAALAVMVPLYLLDRGIDVGNIGLILAVAPLAFMVLRILLASIADDLGTRVIGVIYSVTNLLAIGIYSVSSSILGFMMGTMAEGVRAAGFWAVVRTDILSDNDDGHPGRALAYFAGVRQLADGLGRLAVGFMLAYLAFQNSFLLLGALSLVLFALVLSLKNGPFKGFRINRNTVGRIFRKRSSAFWRASLLFMFLFVSTGTLFAFILPLYLYESLSMSYAQIGGVIALLSLVTAVASLAGVKLNLSKNVLLLFTFLIVPALVLLPFSGSNLLLLIIVIGLGTGFSNVLAEYLLADAVSTSKDVSTDIGVIYVPLRLCEFVFLSAGGFMISQWGYPVLFYTCAILISLFVLFARTPRAGPSGIPV